MPTSVVTGGAGFLGSHLCEYLLAQKHRVICLDNLETASLVPRVNRADPPVPVPERTLLVMLEPDSR